MEQTTIYYLSVDKKDYNKYGNLISEKKNTFTISLTPEEWKKTKGAVVGIWVGKRPSKKDIKN
jgi:hypothetical protein